MNVKRRFQFCTGRCRQYFDLDSSAEPYASHVGVHPRNMGSTETVLARRRRWNIHFLKIPLLFVRNRSLTQTLDGETEWSGMMQRRTPVLPNGILINLVWPMTALRALPAGLRGVMLHIDRCQADCPMWEVVMAPFPWMEFQSGGSRPVAVYHY